jgi:hypothetical protein
MLRHACLQGPLDRGEFGHRPAAQATLLDRGTGMVPGMPCSAAICW